MPGDSEWSLAMDDIHWCCEGLKANALWKSSQQRGLSIVFAKQAGRRCTIELQFRCVDSVHETALANVGVPVSLVIEKRIAFCPWCGASLDEHYGGM
jgi:hypothetical protein